MKLRTFAATLLLAIGFLLINPVSSFAAGTCVCKTANQSGCTRGTGTLEPPQGFSASSLQNCNYLCNTNVLNGGSTTSYDGCTGSYSETSTTYYCCRNNTSTDRLEEINQASYAPTSTEYQTFYNACIDPNTAGTVHSGSCDGALSPAATTDASTRARSQTTPTATSAATTPSTVPGRVTLPNPLGTTNPQELIGRAIKAILSIVGSLALLMFIYGGILWLTARGSSEGVKKGKDIIFWSVAGLVLIFSAYIILGYVLNALRGVVK